MKQPLRFFFRRVSALWAVLALLGSGPALAQVANDDCASAVALTASSVCSVPVNGTVAGATQSLAPTTGCGAGLSTANDVWYSFTATTTSHLVTLAPRFAAILDVRTGTCTASASIFCTGIANNNTTAVQVGGLSSGQTYFIRVYPNSNTLPSGISSTFALCIGQGATGPANDDCAGAISLPVTTGACTGTVSADNTLATASAGVPQPFCASYQGRDLWFSVVVPASGGLTVQTVIPAAGSPVNDTGMSMYSGTCGSLTEIGCDDDAAGNLKSLLSFAGRTPGEVLYVRVWAFGNSQSGPIALCATALTTAANDDCAGAVPLPVTATCVAPVGGTLSGASQSLPPTTNCNFNTTANDVWYSFVASGATQLVTLAANFGAVIDVRSGTCASSASVFCGTAFGGQPLTVSGLTSGQPYFLRLYLNGTFQPANPAFTLCLQPGPVPPANDECSGAIPLSVTTNCVAPVTGTVAGASQSLPATAGCGVNTTVSDVWYSFVATGTSQTITASANFGLVLNVRSGTCANSASVFCGTVFTGQSVVVTGLSSGQTYFLRVYANTVVPPLPTNSAFALCLTAGPVAAVNDECATAVAVAVVQGCATSTNGTVFGASQSLPPTANCGTGVTSANDVWYSFVASSTNQLITLNTRFTAVLDVRSGTCGTSTSLFCTSVFANNTTGTVVGGLTLGQTYFIRIYANGATPPLPANATFTLCVSPAPTPPANDECAGAIAVPVTAACATPVSGTVEAASQSLPASTNCGVTTALAQDVWYSFVASGPTQLITLNSLFTATLDVRTGTCAASTSVVCAVVFSNFPTTTLVGGLTSGQTYFVRVYAAGNFQPSAINATFTLCINPGPTPPGNDECAGAVLLPVNAACTPVSGTVAAASQSLPATAGCGFGSGPAADVWYSFVATGTSQNITVGTTQPGFVADVRSGTCAASTSVFCNTVQPGAGQALAVGGLTTGQTYFIRLYSSAGAPPVGAAAGFTICVTTPPLPPANDDCAGALTVPVQFGTTCIGQTTADNTAATGSTGAPAPTCAAYQGRDLWFQVTVPASGTLTVRTVVPTVGVDAGDTGMSIYAGTCGSLTQIGCDDDGGGGFKSLLAFTGRTPGEVLYIRVWTFGGTGTGVLAVCATSPTNCAAPTAPVAASVTSGSAQLSWQPGGPPTAGTTYTVEYGPQGFSLGSGTVLTGLTAPTVPLTGLQSATAYCFYVRQNCPGTNGSSAYAGPVCFTTPCAVPTALAATAVTATAALLGWQTNGTPASGTTYTVEYGPQGFVLGTGTGISGIPNPSFPLSNLQASTTYCFYVRQDCPGATGSAAFAGPVCFTTAAVSTTCPSPGSLAAGSLTATGAQLSWQPGGLTAPGVSYTVQYGLQGFALGTGVTVSGISTGSYALTGLAAATSYCFYVRQDCGGTNGSSAFVGPVCFQTTTTAGGPANDDPCGAVPLAIGTTGSPAPTVSSTNVGATTSGQAGIQLPACAPTTTPRDVWFTMVPAAGITAVTLRLTGAAAGMVRVFTAPSCTAGPFTLVLCQSSGASNTGVSSLVVNTVPGQPYYIAVSGYGPTDTPGAFTLAGAIVTASRAQAETNALLVFPNPSATGQLTLKLSTAAASLTRVSLINALGQLVRTQTWRSGTTEQVFSTQGLATGLYTVQVVVGSNVFTRKVVLE